MVVFGILKNEKKNHRVLEKNDYSFCYTNDDTKYYS